MNRTKTIQVRITAADKKAWSTRAKLEGRTLSNWIRRTCNLVVKP